MLSRKVPNVKTRQPTKSNFDILNACSIFLGYQVRTNYEESDKSNNGRRIICTDDTDRRQ